MYMYICTWNGSVTFSCNRNGTATLILILSVILILILTTIVTLILTSSATVSATYREKPPNKTKVSTCT